MSKEKRRLNYIRDIETEYNKRFKNSKSFFDEGSNYFPNQTSHTGRFFKPFPLFIKHAEGSKIETVDGCKLLDFWQGHFCNILGHNPSIIIETIENLFNNKLGLQMGLYTSLENELVSLLNKQTGFDSFIFTITGTLSTMYGIMIGLAHTKRNKVLKLDGGWHGAQPWSLKGVKFPKGINKSIFEGAGIPETLNTEILTIPLNDVKRLEECFKKHGDDIGVFIMELVLGNAGMTMANKDFVKKARELTTKYGVVLIIDEIVTGFRMHAGGLYKFYGIEPDIVTFGKAISGGMPFACLAGNKQIFSSVSTLKHPRVWADGGTFTSHPATLAAVIKTIEFLSKEQDKIYPMILKNMDMIRKSLKKIFFSNNIPVHITGESNDEGIPNFPIATIRFLRNQELYDLDNPIMHWDTRSVDIELRDHLSKISLILKGVYSWQGLGAMTSAHTENDLKFVLKVYEEFIKEIKDIV